jgi:hypothetical protein
MQLVHEFSRPGLPYCFGDRLTVAESRLLKMMLAESHLCAGAVFGLTSGENLRASPERIAGIGFLETLGDNLPACVANMRTILK